MVVCMVAVLLGPECCHHLGQYVTTWLYSLPVDSTLGNEYLESHLIDTQRERDRERDTEWVFRKECFGKKLWYIKNVEATTKLYCTIGVLLSTRSCLEFVLWKYKNKHG